MADEQVVLEDDILDGEQIRQVPYQPKSDAPSVDTLVPANMRSSIGDALENLEQEVGNLDDYVAGRLGAANREVLYNRFSAEQVDALALAFSNLAKGEAFIIGDQTGIGKGRFVAAVLEYARQRELIPIFVTEKPDLYTDIFRDLADIRAKEFNPLITNSSQKIMLPDGSSIRTGSSDSQKKIIQDLVARQDIGNYDSVFTTYSQLQTVKGQNTERRELLWAIAPMSILVLDESHNAGGAAKTYEEKGGALDRADFVRALVKRASGVVYSSATYAKNPHVMTLYSARTGMRHAVEQEQNLVGLIQDGGVPLQQVLATKLTEAGQYIRRERSYTGVEFGAKVLPVNREKAENIAKAMSLIMVFDQAKQEAVQAMDAEIKSEAKRVMRDDSIGKAGASSTNFTALMHNVVAQTLLAMKAEATVQESLEALRRGEKPVIGLSNTMGSFIGEAADSQSLQPGDPLELSVGDLLERYLSRSRRLLLREYDGAVESRWMSDAELGPQAVAIYEEAQTLIRSMDWSEIPISPIDYIRHRLTQEGYQANELTKRDDRIEYGPNGEQYYELRNAGEKTPEANNKRIQAFNSGELDVIILNRSGASGISLHASEKFSDQRPRRMIIAQPELNIDQFMQMLGRVHRTGQVTRPSFTLLMGDIPAEKRPAAVLLKKLASLNANTTAAREGSFNLARVTDFMNEYGDRVVLELLADRPELNRRLGLPIKGLNEDSELDKIEINGLVAKVTGRIPLLPIAEQDRVYDLIETGYADLLEQERSMGNNILEAEGLDLDARTIAKLEVLPAQEGQTSIFNEPVYLEVVDAKARRKPMTTLEVVNAVRFELGQQPVQTLDEHDEEQMSFLAIEQNRVRVEKIEQQIPVYRELFKARAEEEVLTDKKAVTDTQRRQRVERRLEHYDTRAECNLRELDKEFERLPLGQPVQITDRKTFSTHYGVVEGYSNRTLKVSNPALPSNWKMHILVADSVRRLSIPMSQVNQNYETGYYVEPTDTTWQGKNIYEIFDERQSLSREVRQIFTGNVLKAFEKFSGRLANYTDNNGNVRQGMLMGQDFDLAKRLEKEPVVFPTAQKALDYLDQIGAELKTQDLELTIHPQLDSTNSYTLAAYPGKAGAQYHSDEGLLAAMESEFVSVGGWMKAAVPPERMIGTLEYLMAQEGGKIVAETRKERARQFLGIELPTTRDLLNAASAEVFQAPPSAPSVEQLEVSSESIVPTESVAPTPEIKEPLEQPQMTPVEQERSWPEIRRELIENFLLPDKFVDALHNLGLVRADGFGNRPYNQLILPGVAAGQAQEGRSFWFQIGRNQPSRVLITDSPLEALVLSALDRRQVGAGTVYLSGEVPQQMLAKFAQQGGHVYAAYENSPKGEQRAWELAKELPQVQRRRPERGNWTQQIVGSAVSVQTQDWLRMATALAHSEDYLQRVQEVSIQAPDAKRALQRDKEAFDNVQNRLWSWHHAALETNASPQYLSRVVEVAIAFNASSPQPLSEEAKRAMEQVISYHASQQTKKSREFELEAG